MSRLLTLTQAARRAYVSVTTLRRLIRDGQFPQPIRRNKRWIRVPVDDVNKYLDALEQSRQEQTA